LFDPLNYKGSLDPTSKVLADSIKYHLSKYGNKCINGIVAKHVIPENLSELEKICLLELFGKYLVEKNLRHAIVEVGVSNEGFAA
jgi:hypothetical protein